MLQRAYVISPTCIYRDLSAFAGRNDEIRQAISHMDSDYGWKIENVTAGGPEILANFPPFQHSNTFAIVNGQPRCEVTANRLGLKLREKIDQPRNKSA